MEKVKIAIIITLLIAITVGVSVFIIRQNISGSSIEVTLPTPLTEIEVYVSGEINIPGQYTLPEDSKVADAIEAAGGYTTQAEQSAVNESRTLRTEDHVIVYKNGESIQRININTAEPWLLDALPGIGEATARAIVEYRIENGPFAAIEELKEINGIGDSTFIKLEDKITVR